MLRVPVLALWLPTLNSDSTDARANERAGGLVDMKRPIHKSPLRPRDRRETGASTIAVQAAYPSVLTRLARG